MPDLDILIIGGGLVGCSLACALEGSGLRIGLVESAAPASPAPGFDERKLALAAASVEALTRLGVLTAETPTSPIQRVHVSRAGDFGAVRLSAEAAGRPFLGQVITARELGKALEARVNALQDLQWLRPETVQAVDTTEALASVGLRDAAGRERVLSARLLVAADGTDSFVRPALGIGAQRHDYGQTLLVCSLAMDRPADGTAYERFTADGPVALLPMGGDYGAVCAVAAVEAIEIAGFDDAQYASYFQSRFGWRAGRVLRAGKRSIYPLRRVVAERVTAPRAVLVGNAAQTIHPIGAQGFNLGLRDALTLAECIAAGDPGADDVLGNYSAARQEDRDRTLAFSDGLARATANSSLPMHLLRSMGLLALAHVPGLSSSLVSGAMGYRGRVPVLARSP